MRPNVGLRPTTPQKLAGLRIEPPVSDPMAAAHSPAATAAADPPLDPPGMHDRSHGLRVGGVSVPQAYSCVRVLPIRIAPAARSRVATALSHSGKCAPAATVPAVVGMLAVSMLSLMATGTPCSLPSTRPSRTSRSHASACVRACSLRQMKADSCGSSLAIRSVASASAVTGESVPVRIRSACAMTLMTAFADRTPPPDGYPSGPPCAAWRSRRRSA